MVKVPLSESPATDQRVRCSQPTAIIGLELSDLKPRAVPLSYAADIKRYNEAVHKKILIYSEHRPAFTYGVAMKVLK